MESGRVPLGRQVAFAEALRFWLTLGFISFGGPTGMMHRTWGGIVAGTLFFLQDAVETFHWLTRAPER